MLTETHINHNMPINIPNFNFVVSYKRQNVAVGGVAIYHNERDTSHIVTSHMDIHARSTPAINVINAAEIGEICVGHCLSENHQSLIMVAIYISPNNTINEIMTFIERNLLLYSYKFMYVYIRILFSLCFKIIICNTIMSFNQYFRYYILKN